MSADRKSEFHIHTGAHVVSASVNGITVHKSVSDEEYGKYSRGEMTFRQLVAIEETSVRSSILGDGEVDWNISSNNSHGLNLTDVSARTTSREGNAAVEVSKGQSAVTKSAARYANEYSSQNPPSIVDRVRHVIGAATGNSSLSEQFYGPDGRNIPVPSGVQSAIQKADRIDKGRQETYREMRRRVLSVDPDAILTVDSVYGGHEVRNVILDDSPARVPHVHVSGSAFGHQTITTTHDGLSAKVAHDANEISDRTGLSLSEARNLAQNSIIDYTDGKITGVTPTVSYESPKGGISYTLGGREVSQKEWEQSRHRS